MIRQILSFVQMTKKKKKKVEAVESWQECFISFYMYVLLHR